MLYDIVSFCISNPQFANCDARCTSPAKSIDNHGDCVNYFYYGIAVLLLIPLVVFSSDPLLLSPPPPTKT